MCPGNNHQSLRRVKVSGVKPEGSAWYECKCGEKLLVSIIASYPQDEEVQEAKEKNVRVSRIYSANDQSDWASLASALAHNKMLAGLEEVEAFLVPRSPALEVGAGYMQQELNQITEVKGRLMSLLLKHYPKVLSSDMTLKGMIVGIREHFPFRSTDPIFQLYKRLACMDEQGREWQTPELAKNPSMGKPVELNKKQPAPSSKEEPNEQRAADQQPHRK